MAEFFIKDNFEIILSFCDRVTITAFRLTSNKWAEALNIDIINHKLGAKTIGLTPGQHITIKDKCRSPLFLNYPISRQQAIQFLPIIYESYLVNTVTDLPLFVFNDEPICGKKKYIEWAYIHEGDFDDFIQYRSLEEIKLFIGRFYEKCLYYYAFDNKIPISEHALKVDDGVNKVEIYKQMMSEKLVLFANKRAEVIEYFLSLELKPQCLEQLKLANNLLVFDHIKHINLSQIQTLKLLSRLYSKKNEDYLLAFMAQDYFKNPRALNLYINHKNICLLDKFVKARHKINYNQSTLIFNDKSAYHRILNNRFLDIYVDNHLYSKDIVLSMYLKRYGIEGCLKCREKGPFLTHDGSIDLSFYDILEHITPTKEDVKWFIKMEFPLPRFLLLKYLKQKSELIPVFKWLYLKKNIPVSSRGINKAIEKKEYTKLIYKMGRGFKPSEVVRFLLYSALEQTYLPSIPLKFLAKFKQEINEEIISALARGRKHSSIRVDELLKELINYPFLVSKKKDKLIFALKNTYIDCVATFDPTIIKYSEQIFPKGKQSFNAALRQKRPLPVLKQMMLQGQNPDLRSVKIAKANGYNKKIIGRISRIVALLYPA